MENSDAESERDENYRGKSSKIIQERVPREKLGRSHRNRSESEDSSSSSSESPPAKKKSKNRRYGHSRRRRSAESLEDLVNKRVSEILASQNYQQNFSMINPVAKHDLVPIFDPEKSSLTAANWLNKIDQLAEIHGWNDANKSFFMQAKLQGIAKTWYDSVSNYGKTWVEWKQAVIEAFPSHEYFIDNI